jgi:hypothetical protein
VSTEGTDTLGGHFKAAKSYDPPTLWLRADLRYHTAAVSLRHPLRSARTLAAFRSPSALCRSLESHVRRRSWSGPFWHAQELLR